MKRALFLCGLIAALLCLAQNANAQYARKGANLVDQHGVVLSDQEIMQVVGKDIYYQTVVGARKQYKAGRRLIWGGATGILAGAVCMGVGTALIDKNTHYNDWGELVYDDESKAMTGGGLLIGGYLVAALGSTALTIGIPINIIGKKRLNWVEEQANTQRYSINVGATPNGAGLVVRF